jgi:hypothetical protein
MAPPSALRTTTSHGGTCHMNSSRNAACETKVASICNSRNPDRLIERREKQADHRGVDAAKRRLCRIAAPQLLPKGKRANYQKKRRQEHGNEANNGADPAVGLRAHDGT